MRMQPEQRYRLCTLTELDEPGAKGMEVDAGIGVVSLVVVRWEGQVQVFRNRCPHIGIELNFMPDVFFDTENRFLQCSNHGALFNPDDGLCVHGPCNGQSLTREACVVIDGEVYWQPYSAV